ncbi:YkvA family protein [Paenibacillus xanthanilyticus]|uniref:YkvA family protein n=1 Tax=Paenibacillus xanthanilyticus TaxID=1783531 RepID=A0ABV8K4J9_9BACL
MSTQHAIEPAAQVESRALGTGVPEVPTPYDPKQEQYVRKGFFGKMKRFAGKVPFAKDAVAMYYTAIDSKTPLYAKGIAFSALAYFILPVDSVPDVLVGLGLTDDLAIVAAAVKALGSNVKAHHREKAEAFFDN